MKVNTSDLKLNLNITFLFDATDWMKNFYDLSISFNVYHINRNDLNKRTLDIFLSIFIKRVSRPAYIWIKYCRMQTYFFLVVENHFFVFSRAHHNWWVGRWRRATRVISTLIWLKPFWSKDFFRDQIWLIMAFCKLECITENITTKHLA